MFGVDGKGNLVPQSRYPVPIEEGSTVSETDPSIVPATVVRAAKRAFIRTTAAAYAATIPSGGITSGAILSLIQNPDPWLLAASIGAAVLSPPLAGIASYLSILSRGIPEDYRP